MRKNLLTMLTALLSMGLYAQVGINTEDPKASLDIVANTASPTANGLLVPRLTVTEVKAMESKITTEQNSLLIYITDITGNPGGTKYADIDAVGYYYYDAPNRKWKKLGNGANATPYTAGAGIEIGGNVVSATGLERRVVTNTTEDYYAWYLIGRDKKLNASANTPTYSALGIGAVDLSYGNTDIISGTQTPTGASGQLSTAMGWGTTASGETSVAMGYQTVASGQNALAMGYTTKATQPAATALGTYTTASGSNSLAIGARTLAANTNSFASGFQTQALGENAVAMGESTTASGTNSVAMGENTIAPYENSIAMGRYNATPTDALLMVGNGNYSSTTNVTTRQNALTVYRNGDIEAKKIYDTNGYSNDKLVVASSNGKLRSVNRSDLQYTAGTGIDISGKTIAAKGLDRTEIIKSNFAFSSSSGSAWSLIGRGNGGSSTSMLVLPGQNNTTYYGRSYLPLGQWAVDLSFAPEYEHQLLVIGHPSFPLPTIIKTGASGDYSFATGYGTIASDIYTTAMGKYNATPTNALFMIGNGTSHTARKNALTVYKDGTIEAKKIYDTAGGSYDKVVVTSSDGKLKSVSKSQVGKTYYGGTGITVNNSTNQIKVDPWVEKLRNHHPSIFFDIKDIPNLDDKTFIKGSVGAWYRNSTSDGWTYSGLAVAIGRGDVGDSSWSKLHWDGTFVVNIFSASRNGNYNGRVTDGGSITTGELKQMTNYNGVTNEGIYIDNRHKDMDEWEYDDKLLVIPVPDQIWFVYE